MLASQAVRWLPADFVEASQTGGTCTLVAYAIMLLVFLSEVSSFLNVSYSTMLTLDRRDGDVLQINFDLDMYDIECRNMEVAVFAQRSKERVSTNDDRNIYMMPIDQGGRKHGNYVRPEAHAAYADEDEGDHQKHMKELQKEDGKAELDSDWSSSHDGLKHKSFEHVIQGHDFTLVNFFAGWCSHCRNFAPTWARVAERVNGNDTSPAMEFPDRDGKNRGVRLIRINCVDFQAVCREKGVDAYPMVRLYKADGTFTLFEGRRDEADILRWVERTVKMKAYGWVEHHEDAESGCNIKGRLSVPRVPGHLEFTAGGGDQNLNTKMTNVSHLVKHLSFSDPGDGRYHRRGWAGMPQDVLSHVSPLDDQRYITDKFHTTWIHDMKVVSTVSTYGATAYQISHQKHLSTVPEKDVPQVQFHFDIEPFSIWVKADDKKWYDFVTSMLAMLGGAFVVLRLTSHASLAVVLSLRHLVPRPGSSGRAGSMTIGHFD